jgi:hypothetical protein
MANITINADFTTLELNGTLINDFIQGDFIQVTPVNPLTSRTNGSGGSVNINKRTDGDVYDLVFRVMRYSDSDVFLNSAINSDAPTVFNGSITELFVKDGASFAEKWALEGGSITTLPSITKNNVDGNDVMEYTIQFRRAIRNI